MLDYEKLLKNYIDEYDFYFSAYCLMGALLDKKCIHNRLKEIAVDTAYIYGGGFLGIQCYRAISDFVDVKAIIDKKGRTKVDFDQKPILNTEDFKAKYVDEAVIITPIQFAGEIYDEISSFVDNEKILFIGDLVTGGF